MPLPLHRADCRCPRCFVPPADRPGKGQRVFELRKHPETADAIAGVLASGLFTIEGEERTELMPFEQSLDEYIEFLHSTSVLSRAQLGDRAGAFDAEVRDVFARHGIDRLRYEVVGSVTWAAPK